MRSLLLVLLILGSSSLVFGQTDNSTPPNESDTSNDKKSGDRIETPYGKLCKEFSLAKAALSEEFKKSSTEHKAEIKKELDELPQKWAHRFIELAEKATNGMDAYDPLLWVAVEIREGEYLDTAVSLLKKFQSSIEPISLWIIIPELLCSQSDEINPFLSFLVENNPHEMVKGVACFTLAFRLKQQAERNGSFEAGIQAEKLFERILADFPKVRGRRGQLDELAKSELQDMRGPMWLGKIAPNIKGEDMEGIPFELGDYRGKVIVLSFCGNWCGPCRSMYPHERLLVKKLTNEPFALIGINSDNNKEAVKEVFKTENITWRWFWDGGGTDGPIAKSWHIDSWPVFYVLDRKGTIRHKCVGTPGEDLGKWVDALLHEPNERAEE